jgi:hypothetical protein
LVLRDKRVVRFFVRRFTGVTLHAHCTAVCMRDVGTVISRPQGCSAVSPWPTSRSDVVATALCSSVCDADTGNQSGEL